MTNETQHQQVQQHQEQVKSEQLERNSLTSMPTATSTSTQSQAQYQPQQLLHGRPEPLERETQVPVRQAPQSQDVYHLQDLSSAQEESSDSDRASKKSAFYGQWKTPPQPFFPSGGSGDTSLAGAKGVNRPSVKSNNGHQTQTQTQVQALGQQAPVHTSAAPSVTSSAAPQTLPEGATPDLSGMDLASLQEAYRRGMAAAAALSKHQMETGQNVFAPVLGPTMAAPHVQHQQPLPPVPVQTKQSDPNLQGVGASNVSSKQLPEQAPSHHLAGPLDGRGGVASPVHSQPTHASAVVQGQMPMVQHPSPLSKGPVTPSLRQDEQGAQAQTQQQTYATSGVSETYQPPLQQEVNPTPVGQNPNLSLAQSQPPHSQMQAQQQLHLQAHQQPQMQPHGQLESRPSQQPHNLSQSMQPPVPYAQAQPPIPQTCSQPPVTHAPYGTPHGHAQPTSQPQTHVQVQPFGQAQGPPHSLSQHPTSHNDPLPLNIQTTHQGVGHGQPLPFTQPQVGAHDPSASFGQTSRQLTPSHRSISAPDFHRQVADAANMPDISHDQSGPVSPEEEKRRKRLARNRASARLRRLRKKNLVENYEGEVTVLEQALSKLRKHKWGGNDDEQTDNKIKGSEGATDGTGSKLDNDYSSGDHTALLEALSMERGQQALDPQARRDLIRNILEQQREHVANMHEAHLEGRVLGWLVREGAASGEKKDTDMAETEKVASSEKEPAVKSDDEKKMDDEEAEIAKELRDLLNLTPEQEEQLKQATEGVEEEQRALETVDRCLGAMLENDWLVNQAVEDCIEQFTSIMNPSQISKLLLWTDHNAEAVEQLDFVNAPPAGSEPAQAPAFAFGVDEVNIQDDNPNAEDK